MEILETINKPQDVTALKSMLEKITQAEIKYRNYKGNREKMAIADQVEDIVSHLQKLWEPALVNIGNYSPYILDRETPSWQVDLWEPFIDGNKLSIDNFHNKVWVILKSRQIGFSYTMFRLQVALALSMPDMRCLLGAKDKTWIQSILSNIAPEVLPFRQLMVKDRNDLFRSMGLATGGLGFNNINLSYIFPDNSLIKLLGIDTISDKNRGLGNVSLIGIDEAAFVDNASIITTVLKPMLNFNQGSFIMGSTPNGDNWFKGYVEESKTDTSSRFRINEYNLYTCGVYSEQECDRILWESFEDYLRLNPTMTPYEAILLVAQEYLAFFNDYGRSKKFFPRFAKVPDKYTYLGSLIKYADKENYEVYVSIDYGGSGDAMAVLFLAVGKNGNIYVFDELTGREMGIRDAVQAINKKLIMWQVEPRMFFIDKSTTARSIVMDKNTSIKISDLFIEQGLDVTPVARMPKINRIDIVNEYMQPSPDSEHPITNETPASKLFISDTCHDLIKQMVTLTYEVDGSGKGKKFNEIKHDDLVDALLYAVTELSGYKYKNRHQKGQRYTIEKSMGRTNTLVTTVNRGGVRYERKKPKITRFI